MTQPIISLREVTKHYPGVRALSEVTLDFHLGEVHALLGENGAGKSTLINIMAGLQRPTTGQYLLDGRDATRVSLSGLRQLGITAVFQEFSLASDLTIEENIFLGRELRRFGILQRSLMRKRSAELLSRLSFDLDPATHVRELSRAGRQMVEIAKAVLVRPKVLILDEPTASLTQRESECLFEVVTELKNAGSAIVYVSHRLDELRLLADRVSVLRDGRKVASRSMMDISDAALVELMSGRELGTLFPPKPQPSERVELKAVGLQTACGTVKSLDLEAHSGEIVGVAGLVGCGKSELGQALFGLKSLASGTVELQGRRVQHLTPRRMIRAGLCYFPADRGRDGTASNRSIRENMTMAALGLRAFSRGSFLRLRAERTTAGNISERFLLRPRDVEVICGILSGGNRQKVVISRAMTRDFSVFIFDEPTVGIDIGARAEIYQLIVEFAQSGAAVILISSDNSEIVHLSNRVYVMHGGRLVRELAGSEISDENILRSIFKVSDCAEITA